MLEEIKDQEKGNVSKKNIKNNDIFTTVVDMKWRWCLLGFGVSFFTSWSAFAVLYYLMMLMHRDFDHLDDAHWPHCIKNMRNFLSVFMFSVETQHTIGYGNRYPTEDCPHLVVTVCFQSVLGLMIQTLMTGVVFAKLARPKKRAATLVFSRRCCICMRDGKLCLLFRVGDMRKSHLAEAHVRLQMISKKVTDEGENFLELDVSNL
uniref:Uncharacterized protein n=1 Tax=Romanomermis culicivorax TaxID=13658 RepID=A0A915K672_ROMCU